ncbi:glucose dehydrogenase precursor short protein [Pyrenophora tritici-repentis Pt-1C-BFP]|uniref:Glucose dehydrogenase short protein n=3 Tax=Pyrenophora tritici-repentis TaxID=45151 RepID=B2W169_PYRTR|nr:glucose dehydrogenase precursor short protein [Pyrenophora tritici-repentis Pt-1C-BFP]EDU47042.1 glucose dehydrogenase precursor short protein [Pyrenophora tritici-repentis Pt-1C-BFP]
MPAKPLAISARSTTSSWSGPDQPHAWSRHVSRSSSPITRFLFWKLENIFALIPKFKLLAEQSGPTADNDVGSLDRLHTSFPRTMGLIQSRWVEAFEELGHSTNPTGFVESYAGAVNVTNAIDASKGERSHAGTAFLDSALNRGNVTLRTGVNVDKIAFDELLTADGKLNANGIHYTYNGEDHLISGREIILCAGAFESPAILERSGIGSKEVLAAANIPILYELPGVGENLQDHLNCGLSFETRDDIATRDDMLETPTETQELIQKVQQWVAAETNPSLKAQYALIQEAIESPSEATATTFMLRLQRHKDAHSLPKDIPSVVDGNYITVVAIRLSNKQVKQVTALNLTCLVQT